MREAEAKNDQKSDTTTQWIDVEYDAEKNVGE
jgi:hypothetical protein